MERDASPSAETAPSFFSVVHAMFGHFMCVSVRVTHEDHNKDAFVCAVIIILEIYFLRCVYPLGTSKFDEYLACLHAEGNVSAGTWR